MSVNIQQTSFLGLKNLPPHEMPHADDRSNARPKYIRPSSPESFSHYGFFQSNGSYGFTEFNGSTLIDSIQKASNDWPSQHHSFESFGVTPKRGDSQAVVKNWVVPMTEGPVLNTEVNVLTGMLYDDPHVKTMSSNPPNNPDSQDLTKRNPANEALCMGPSKLGFSSQKTMNGIVKNSLSYFTNSIASVIVFSVDKILKPLSGSLANEYEQKLSTLSINVNDYNRGLGLFSYKRVSFLLPPLAE